MHGLVRSLQQEGQEQRVPRCNMANVVDHQPREQRSVHVEKLGNRNEHAKGWQSTLQWYSTVMTTRIVNGMAWHGVGLYPGKLILGGA